MTERDVQDSIVGLMAARGWVWHRTQFGFVPGAFQTGSPGMPDGFFVRYMGTGAVPARCLFLWCEFKSPSDRRGCECMKRQLAAAKSGKRRRPGLCPYCRQKAWQDAERSKGAMVIKVSSPEAFAGFYERAFGFLHRNEPPAEAKGQLPLIS